MKGKVILKSLLASYILTGAALMLLAFLLFTFDLGETAVAVGIVAVYVAACLFGGFLTGKMVRKEKYFWGLILGVAYYILFLAVSFLAKGRWDMSFAHAVTTFFMCVGGGALGGMLS